MPVVASISKPSDANVSPSSMASSECADVVMVQEQKRRARSSPSSAGRRWQTTSNRHLCGSKALEIPSLPFPPDPPSPRGLHFRSKADLDLRQLFSKLNTGILTATVGAGGYRPVPKAISGTFSPSEARTPSSTIRMPVTLEIYGTVREERDWLTSMIYRSPAYSIKRYSSRPRTCRLRAMLIV